MKPFLFFPRVKFYIVPTTVQPSGMNCVWNMYSKYIHPSQMFCPGGKKQ